MFLLMAAYASQIAAAPILKSAPSSAYNYPVSAIERGDEGSARFAASISPQGRIYGCDILKSSGTPALDRATCTTVRHMRATPARDASGAPIYGVVTGWIDWTLNGTPASSYIPAPIGVDFSVNRMPPHTIRSDLRLNLVVDENGHVDGCYVTESAGGMLDALACRQAKGFSQIAAIKDVAGNPVRSAQALDVRFHSGPMPTN